ncbi:MAG: hypothetical protein EA343_04470 [Nodularia sp. (in: Bacteria)]|nr:MAG: hypothetical protein EA343_04470 [Nodularia sp. (in: cyanobacteria)]
MYVVTVAIPPLPTAKAKRKLGLFKNPRIWDKRTCQSHFCIE